MTINLSAERTSLPNYWIQLSFFAIAVLFNLCLIAQLLTVGLAIFDDSNWWHIHVWLVRGYSGLILLLLAGLFIGSFPRKIQVLTASMAVLLILQFITIYLNHFLPVGIFHPLIGFSLFTSSTTLVHEAWRFRSSSIPQFESRSR